MECELGEFTALLLLSATCWFARDVVKKNVWLIVVKITIMDRKSGTLYVLVYTHDSYNERMRHYICHTEMSDGGPTTVYFLPSPSVIAHTVSRAFIDEHYVHVPLPVGNESLCLPKEHGVMLLDRVDLPDQLANEVFINMPARGFPLNRVAPDEVEGYIRQWFVDHMETVLHQIQSEYIARPATCGLSTRHSSCMDAMYNGEMFHQRAAEHFYRWRTQCTCDAAYFDQCTLVAIPTFGRPDWAFATATQVLATGLTPVLFLEQHTLDTVYPGQALTYRTILHRLTSSNRVIVDMFSGRRTIGQKRQHMLQAARAAGATYLLQIDDSVDLDSIRRYATSDMVRASDRESTNKLLSTKITVLDLLLATETLSACLYDVVAVGLNAQMNSTYQCSWLTGKVTYGSPYKLVCLDIRKMDNHTAGVPLNYHDVPYGEDLLFYHDVRAAGLSTAKLLCGVFFTHKGVSRQTTGVSDTQITTALSLDQALHFDRLFAFCRYVPGRILAVVYQHTRRHGKVTLWGDVKGGQTKYKSTYLALYKNFTERWPNADRRTWRYGDLRQGPLYDVAARELHPGAKTDHERERKMLSDITMQYKLDEHVFQMASIAAPFHRIPVPVYTLEGPVESRSVPYTEIWKNRRRLYTNQTQDPRDCQPVDSVVHASVPFIGGESVTVYNAALLARWLYYASNNMRQRRRIDTVEDDWHTDDDDRDTYRRPTDTVSHYRLDMEHSSVIYPPGDASINPFEPWEFELAVCGHELVRAQPNAPLGTARILGWSLHHITGQPSYCVQQGSTTEWVAQGNSHGVTAADWVRFNEARHPPVYPQSVVMHADGLYMTTWVHSKRYEQNRSFRTRSMEAPREQGTYEVRYNYRYDRRMRVAAILSVAVHVSTGNIYYVRWTHDGSVSTGESWVSAAYLANPMYTTLVTAFLATKPVNVFPKLVHRIVTPDGIRLNSAYWSHCKTMEDQTFSTNTYEHYRRGEYIETTVFR